MMAIRHFGPVVSISRSCAALFRTYTREQVKLKFPASTRKATPSTSASRSLPFVVESYLAAASDSSDKNDGHELHSSGFGENTGIASTTPAESNTLNSGMQLADLGDPVESFCTEDSDALRPLSVHCSGCGSPLHCRSAEDPGFITRDKYLELQSEPKHKLLRRGYVLNRIPVLCHRCTLLIKHRRPRTAFSPSASTELFASVIGSEEDATVLLVTDMTNLPHSIVPDLGNILKCHRYIVIGNKVDQLPVDGRNYLQRWTDTLLDAVRCTCSIEPCRIVHTSLTSALTGFGISQLVDFLLGRRFHSMSPMFIIGSTNVGKSSIFNRLLMSDLCKSEAREAIHRATVSPWPGTTAGVLRFPLSRMDPTKRALREESKYYNQPSNSTTAFAESCGFKYLTAQPVPTIDPKSYTPIGSAVQDARDLRINLLNMPTYIRRDISTDGETSTALEASDFELTQLRKRHLSDVSVDVGRWPGDKSYRLLTTRMDPRQYHDRAWCSDTPGFVCSDQILNYLPISELEKIESGNPYGSKDRARLRGAFGNVGKVLIPRNFVMRPGLSLLLGRLGRLDVMQAPGPVYFTTFSFLPVHIVEQSDVDEYVKKHAASLGPGHRPPEESDATGPFGTLPPFQSRVLEPIKAQSSLDSSAADVVLSGAGWISVAGVLRRHASRCEGDELARDTDPSGDAAHICDDSESTECDPDSNVHLCAWTPGALGISVRKPALIPDVIKRRKRRFFMTREFSLSA